MQKLSKPVTCFVSRIDCFSVGSSLAGINSNNVFEDSVSKRADWITLVERGHFEGDSVAQFAQGVEKKHLAAKEDDEGRSGHGAEADKGVMWGGAHNQLNLSVVSRS